MIGRTIVSPASHGHWAWRPRVGAGHPARDLGQVTFVMGVKVFAFLHTFQALRPVTKLAAQPFKIFVGPDYAKHPLCKEVKYRIVV